MIYPNRGKTRRGNANSAKHWPARSNTNRRGAVTFAQLHSAWILRKCTSKTHRRKAVRFPNRAIEALQTLRRKLVNKLPARAPSRELYSLLIEFLFNHLWCTDVQLSTDIAKGWGLPATSSRQGVNQTRYGTTDQPGQGENPPGSEEPKHLTTSIDAEQNGLQTQVMGDVHVGSGKGKVFETHPSYAT